MHTDDDARNWLEWMIYAFPLALPSPATRAYGLWFVEFWKFCMMVDPDQARAFLQLARVRYGEQRVIAAAEDLLRVVNQ